MEHRYPSLPMDGLPERSTPPLDLLAGIKVLDLTTSIAGLYAGQLLADLGATVVKVERPGSGDDARAWGPPFLDGESLWFISVNRGKQSVTLDHSRSPGRETLLSLVSLADVVLLNLVPRVQKKLGLDFDSLGAVNPRLIHLSQTGFGLRGERAELPCYDLIAEGYAGIMDLTGEADGAPQKVGTPAADLLAGHDAAMAVLAALLRRDRNGKGCTIDVSMVESMARFVSPRLLPYLGSGEVSRRSGGRDSVIAIYQVFDTADDPITLGLGNDAIWTRFWEAVGRPENGRDPANGDNVRRRANRQSIVDQISEVLKQRPRVEWLRILNEAKVPAGPIQRLDHLAADPALHASGFLYRSAGVKGPVPQVGLGIRFDGQTEGTHLPPPTLGQHTDKVLSTWLGYDQSMLQELRQSKVI